MSVHVTDIVIIMVSLAACAYCALLNHRLKALQNTKDGLGATIVAMSKSVSTMTATTDQTRVQAGELARRLSTLLTDADEMCTRVASLNEAMNGTHAEISERVSQAHVELEDSMRQLLDESKGRILEMTALLRQMQTLMQTSSIAREEALDFAPRDTAPRPPRYRYEY